MLSGDKAFWELRTRYVLFGIAPILLFAVLSWARLACVSKRTAVACLGLIGFAFSTSFYFNYFDFIWETGGRARTIYRTASQEPKVAALDLIREHADGLGAEGESLDVYPATFWEEWPLAYLAWNDQRIRVRSLTRGCNSALDINIYLMAPKAAISCIIMARVHRTCDASRLRQYRGRKRLMTMDQSRRLSSFALKEARVFSAKRSAVLVAAPANLSGRLRQGKFAPSIDRRSLRTLFS